MRNGFKKNSLRELIPTPNIHDTKGFDMSANIWGWICSYLESIPKTDDAEALFEKIFVPQEYNWDCGVSCLKMVLKWWGSSDSNADVDIFTRSKTPLWTIDIYLHLRELGIDGAQMFTTVLGVNPSHYSNSWYNAHIDGDVERVTKKFQIAHEKAWIIHQERLATEKMVEILVEKKGLIIALVDCNTLRNRTDSAEYSGHYIVLVGYDVLLQEVVYLDPAFIAFELRRATIGVFDAARSHAGTDDDMIVIVKPPPLPAKGEGSGEDHLYSGVS